MKNTIDNKLNFSYIAGIDMKNYNVNAVVSVASIEHLTSAVFKYGNVNE